jgi:DNA-binding NarL/FixJ family response regulator
MQELFRKAMDIGGKGYLSKDSAVQEVLEGLRAVCAGRLYISSAVATTLLGRRETPRPPVDPLMDQLTPTERLVVKLIVEGKSSKEIGTVLSIHYRTVENHRTNICRKFGVEGANALLRFVLQRKASL